ncbi:hypothetical protein EV127DRAFT_437801 [Xylaria flabelliformis]|nr:hypothetical protein EV127DRAFT_437801 [Xylaria flabelliformis]
MLHPQLRRIRRKFGRHDFERYEDITADASLGAKSLGQVTVDCRFRFERSQWGVLTRARHPGGIVYLDLDFHQPGDHRLKYATVIVTLDDDSDDLINQFPVINSLDDAKVSIHIGDYGPTQIVGAAKSAHKVVEHQAAPEIDAGGIFTIGNIGRRSEKDFDQEHRWTFLSQKKPAKNDSSRYKVLKWTITENKLDAQSYHSNTIHTAFSFQHGGRPFFIQVAIEGSLQSKWSNLGRKFSSLKDEKFATTLVNFNGRERFTKVLDQMAQGLPYTMEQENIMKVPPEAKGPQEPTYRETLPCSPLQEFNTSQERRQPLSVTDNPLMKEEADQCDSTDGRAIKEEDLANAVRSLSSPSKLSKGKRDLRKSYKHTQLSIPKLHVIDEPDTREHHSMKEGRQSFASEEKKRNLTNPPKLLRAFFDHEEARYKLKTDLLNFTRVPKVDWKLLLQRMLQIFGLSAVVGIMVNWLTHDDPIDVSTTAWYSASSAPGGS